MLKLALPTEVLTFPNCTKLVTLYRSACRLSFVDSVMCRGKLRRRLMSMPKKPGPVRPYAAVRGALPNVYAGMYTEFAKVGVMNGPVGATVALPVLATMFGPKPLQCLVVRALPVNAGFSVGIQVDCAGLV